MVMAPNIKPGQCKAVLVKQVSALEQVAKYRKRIYLTSLNGELHHIHYRRDWRALQSELMVLKMTNVQCSCLNKSYNHKLWEIVEEDKW